jgi:predicted nucleotidyltransferase
MNDHVRELLEYLRSHRVEFLVIGAHAVSFHSRPRGTEDIDLWVNRERGNADRLKAALEEFGAPIGDEGAEQFANLDRQMIRLGVPPHMADILNFAGSKPFEDVWASRCTAVLLGVEVAFPSREDLMEMKAAAGRPQDMADLDRLRKTEP